MKNIKMKQITNSITLMIREVISILEPKHPRNVYSTLTQTGMKLSVWKGCVRIVLWTKLHSSMPKCQLITMIWKITRFSLENNIKMHMTVMKVSISPKRQPLESMFVDRTRPRGRSSSLRRSSLRLVASIIAIMGLKIYQSLSKSLIRVCLDVKCTNQRLKRLKKL